MGAFDSVANPQSRPLPVIVLADNSGSMNDNGKLDSLKSALTDMVKSFKNASASSLEADIYVAIVAFGNNSTNIILEPKSATEIADTKTLNDAINSMQAVGNTPLGLALTNVVEMLERRESYPSRAYRPFIVLASDGYPNDEWEKPLKQLLSSERGKKATRLALAIGVDADETMLKKFVDNDELPVFRAKDASEIKKFFKCVTMSVVKVSQSFRTKISREDIIRIVQDADDLFED